MPTHGSQKTSAYPNPQVSNRSKPALNTCGNGGEFYDWFKGKDGLIKQARNQLEAAGDTPIQWHFKTENTLNATKKLLQQEGIEGIDFIHNPSN